VAPIIVEHGVVITVKAMMFIIKEPVMIVAVQEVPVLAILTWMSS